MGRRGQAIKSVELRVRAASLAAEARIIRYYERRHLRLARELVLRTKIANTQYTNTQKERIFRKAARKLGEKAASRALRLKSMSAIEAIEFLDVQDRTYHSLFYHRIKVLRCEARATHLARGFLKGIPYGWIERRTDSPPPFSQALKIAVRFSEEDAGAVRQRFSCWLDKSELPNSFRHI